jgi:hypothetical protein
MDSQKSIIKLKNRDLLNYFVRCLLVYVITYIVLYFPSYFRKITLNLLLQKFLFMSFSRFVTCRVIIIFINCYKSEAKSLIKTLISN